MIFAVFDLILTLCILIFVIFAVLLPNLCTLDCNLGNLTTSRTIFSYFHGAYAEMAEYLIDQDIFSSISTTSS